MWCESVLKGAMVGGSHLYLIGKFLARTHTTSNITKIVKVTENRQRGTFSPSVVLDQEMKKLIKNTLQLELRLKMIVEPRTLVTLREEIHLEG